MAECDTPAEIVLEKYRETSHQYVESATSLSSVKQSLDLPRIVNLRVVCAIFPNYRGIDIEYVETAFPEAGQHMVDFTNHARCTFEQVASRVLCDHVALRSEIGESNSSQLMSGAQRDCRYKWSAYVSSLKLHDIKHPGTPFQLLQDRREPVVKPGVVLEHRHHLGAVPDEIQHRGPLTECVC